jgi:hypothetical protein
MKHYVAYHSTEGMGYPLKISNEGAGFVSNKGLQYLKNAVGEKVWIITGTRRKGKRKAYYLVGYYIPSVVKKSTDRDFAWSIDGEESHGVKSPMYLNDCEWFPALFKSQGSFAFGITEIRQPEIVKALEQLVKEGV